MTGRGGSAAIQAMVLVATVAVLFVLSDPHMSWAFRADERCRGNQRTVGAALEMYRLDHDLRDEDFPPDLVETLLAEGHLSERPEALEKGCELRAAGAKGLYCPVHGGLVGRAEPNRLLEDGRLAEALRARGFSPLVSAVVEKLEEDYRAERDLRRVLLGTTATMLGVLLLVTLVMLAYEGRTPGKPLPGVRARRLPPLVLAVGVGLWALPSLPLPLDLSRGRESSWVAGAEQVTWAHVRRGQVGPALAQAGVGEDELWVIETLRHGPRSARKYSRRRAAIHRGFALGFATYLLLLGLWHLGGRPGLVEPGDAS